MIFYFSTFFSTSHLGVLVVLMLILRPQGVPQLILKIVYNPSYLELVEINSDDNLYYIALGALGL